MLLDLLVLKHHLDQGRAVRGDRHVEHVLVTFGWFQVLGFRFRVKGELSLEWFQCGCWEQTEAAYKH